jgi:hypothetical protein
MDIHRSGVGPASRPAVPAAAATIDRGPLGYPIILLIVHLVIEYGRPAYPMKIPLVVSVVLFFSWLAQPKKRWPPQLICFLLFLVVIAAMGPFAVNSFSIFSGFQLMAVELLCICTPLMFFVNSLRKLHVYLGAWLVVFSYLAVYGLLHGGQGPGGHIGDENDLALALNMAIPVAFAFVTTARSALVRGASAVAFLLMVGTVCVTFSRGGFLGLIAVLLYCLFVMMRRKALAPVFVGVAVAALLLAPQSYRDRLNSIVGEAQGTEHGTGELRQEFWAIARRMYAANPVLGVGLDNFRWNANRYESEEQEQRLGRDLSGTVAHSVYFTLLAELGSCGGVLFALLIFYTLRDTGRVLRAVRQRLRAGARDNPDPSGDPTFRSDLRMAGLYAHAIRAALIGYLVSGTFLAVLTYPHFWILVALTVALHDSTRARLGLAPSTVLGRAPASALAVAMGPATWAEPSRG